MIQAHITDRFEQAPFKPARIEQLARLVCRRFSVSKGVVGVVIVDDSTFRRLNREFLDRDGTSDCLSFDLSDESQRCLEVIVNGQVAIDQARARGHEIEAEIALYTVHGLLHQLGFDDGDEPSAAQMHAMEDEILTEQGYGRVYTD